MKTSRQALGAWGEDQAATFLKEKGYSIIERNVRTAYGEIDLVAVHQYSIQGLKGENVQYEMLVFVEVKTRSSRSFGYPEQSVNARKMLHMLASAQAYVQEHPELSRDWRIDVIAVTRLEKDAPPEITHFENAITY